MQTSISRGGAKPRMLPRSAQELGITVGNGRKFGMYELSDNKTVIARRVELPTWLSEAWMGKNNTDSIRIPSDAKSESRGHIFLRPPRDQFNGPAVGLDVEIYNVMREIDAVTEIQFFVYGIEYKLVDIWSIHKAEYVRRAKLVHTKPPFMPQWMIEINRLVSVMPNNRKYPNSFQTMHGMM